MTEPRDIEKDKATVEWFDSRLDSGVPTTRIALYWIAQYEAVAADLDKYHKLHDEGYNEMRLMIGQYEAAQARIAELERQRDMFSKAIEERTERDRARSEEMAKDRERWT